MGFVATSGIIAGMVCATALRILLPAGYHCTYLFCCCRPKRESTEDYSLLSLNSSTDRFVDENDDSPGMMPHIRIESRGLGYAYNKDKRVLRSVSCNVPT